jgi:hypothetical protein
MPEIANLPPATRAQLLRSVNAGKTTFWMAVRSLAIGGVVGVILFALLKKRFEDDRTTLIAIAVGVAVLIAVVAYQITLQRMRAALREYLKDNLPQ